MPSINPLTMPLSNRARCPRGGGHGGHHLLHELETRAPGPRVLFVQEHARPVAQPLFVDVLESEPQVMGARRFQIGFCE